MERKENWYTLYWKVRHPRSTTPPEFSYQGGQANEEIMPHSPFTEGKDIPLYESSESDALHNSQLWATEEEFQMNVDAIGHDSERSISSAGLQEGMDDIYPETSAKPPNMISSTLPVPTGAVHFLGHSGNHDGSDVESVSSMGIQCDPDLPPVTDVHAERVEQVLSSYTPIDSGNEAGDSADERSFSPCSSTGLFAETFEPSMSSPIHDSGSARRHSLKPIFASGSSNHRVMSTRRTPPTFLKRKNIRPPESTASDLSFRIKGQGPALNASFVGVNCSPDKKKEEVNALLIDQVSKEAIAEANLIPPPHSASERLKLQGRKDGKRKHRANIKIEPGLSDDIIDLANSPPINRSLRKQAADINAAHLAGEIIELTDSDQSNIAPPAPPLPPNFFSEARTDMNGSSTLSTLNKMYKSLGLSTPQQMGRGIIFPPEQGMEFLPLLLASRHASEINTDTGVNFGVATECLHEFHIRAHTREETARRALASVRDKILADLRNLDEQIQLF